MPLNTFMFNKFYQQRKAANKRNIVFNLTYDEWLDVWQSSGKLHLRGVGKGKYCMARKGDQGPYEIGNIEIIPFEQNNRDQAVNGKNHLKNNKVNRNWIVPSKGNHYKTYPVKVKHIKLDQDFKYFECIQDAADYYGVDKSTIGRNMRKVVKGKFIVERV